MKNYKENLILIIGMMIILGTHLVSCEKVPTPPVVEPELMPKLELSVTPQGEIPYGEVATLKWKTINALRVFVNDERQENYKEGNKGTGKLFKNTKFVVRATNVKLFTEEVVDIEVGPWYETTFGLVSYYPWEFIALIIFNDDELVLDYWIPDPSILGGISYFHQDGTVSYNFTTETATWSVPNENTLLINGFEKRLQVSREELVISYEITYSGKPAWFGMVYKHPSDVPTDPI